jgi:bleomycin hydrolase
MKPSLPLAAALPSLLALVPQASVASAPKRDRAVYVDRTLLDRERQEEEARDRFLAERKGMVYKQAEEAPGQRFSMDFSGLERPHAPAEFKTLWHFPPKRQWWTNTCWCFSTTSFMESELKRIHGQEIKLSEMYTVYWDWVEKAREYVRTKGQSVFDEGSEGESLFLRWKQYGVVREGDYTGLPKGQTVFNHQLLAEELKAYVAFVKKGAFWDEATVVAGVRGILDKHMGVPPERITVEGREFTPRQFLEEKLKLGLDDYVEFMSFQYAPFYAKAEYTVPDNWWHSKEYYNLPLGDWYQALKGAVEAGYTVAIGGDVSEPGYEGAEDVAIVPSFDIPQDYIDQSAREFRFTNHTTEDDHGIHIVGCLRKGKRDWFLVKDSARSAQRGVPGYYFYREDYLKLKMLTFTVHKDAVKAVLAKFTATPKG